MPAQAPQQDSFGDLLTGFGGMDPPMVNVAVQPDAEQLKQPEILAPGRFGTKIIPISASVH